MTIPQPLLAACTFRKINILNKIFLKGHCGQGESMKSRENFLIQNGGWKTGSKNKLIRWIRDKSGRSRILWHISLFLKYCFQSLFREAAQNTYTFVQARSNFRNDHMESAASVLWASNKGKWTKEMPGCTSRNNFLTNWNQHSCKRPFQVDSQWIPIQGNRGISHINQGLTHEI